MSAAFDTVAADEAGSANLAERLPDGIAALADFPAALRRLERTSLAAQLDTLHRHRALDRHSWRDLATIAARTGTADRHRWLLKRWLIALTAAGVLEHGEAGWRERTDHGLQAEGDMARDYAVLGFPPQQATLHLGALERLDALLRDETSIQALLFADGRIVETLSVYQDNPFTAYANGACAELLRQRAVANPPRLRILELGGGAGLATGANLAALRGTEYDYQFTDIANLFVQAARDRYADKDGLSYGVVDIDRAFHEQALSPQTLDVVLAANTLHNARNIDATLRAIAETLAPGGWLLFTEATGDNVALLTSMQFLLSAPPGQPNPGSSDLRATAGEVFLDTTRWRERLAAAGFELLAVLPDDARDDLACGDQRLFLAARPRQQSAPHPATELFEQADTRPMLRIEARTWTGGDLHRMTRDYPALPANDPNHDTLARILSHLTPPGAHTARGAEPCIGDVRSMLVAAELDTAVIASIIATWRAGGHVDIVADTAPGRVLQALQRTRADHAVMSAATLAAVELHPALELTDLGALRRALLTDAASTADRSSALPDVERVLVTGRGQPAEPTGAPHIELSPQTIATAIEAQLDGADYRAGFAASEQLSRVALYTMLQGLQRCGVFTKSAIAYTPDDVLKQTAAASRHHALLGRWLDVLTDTKLLACDNAGYRLAPYAPDVSMAAMTPLWDALEQQWRHANETAYTIDFARRAAAELPELIRGRSEAVNLLFPQGNLDLAHAVYSESVTARYQHHAVAQCVRAIALAAERPLRLLEVGAGTGATTDIVLSTLDGQSLDYLFTDVSRLFIGAAQSRHRQIAGFATDLYDIDLPPSEQGYEPGCFDVIIAGGALNAARDTDASLAWLCDLLKAGGWLVVSEPTNEQYWVMASQAFMLTDPADARANTRSTFLSWSDWSSALARAGLECVVDLPAAGHSLASLGHRVFAARVTP